MNLLFLDAYFEPETIAYTHLEKDLLAGLVDANNKIKVICPVPTRGISEKTRKEYKHRTNENQYDGKIRIRRFWAPKEGKNPVIRAFRYFWCNLRTYQIAVKIKNVDTVFSNSTPPTQGMLSAMIAKRLSRKYGRKVPFIYNLQDIFPDSLVNTGLTKKGSLLWKIGRKVEDYTYRNADKIIVISEGFKRNIIEKGGPEEKIEVISNWIDLDSVHPVRRKDNKLLTEISLDPEKFLVVYAGNFGAAQGADIILKAAEKLREYPDIQFCIFGGGYYFEDAKKEAERLDNVFIHELMPSDRISEVYSLGDIALITCKQGIGNAGLPSKTWSIMACNTPIIASFDTDSDLAEIIADSVAGKCVEAGNVDVLADTILENYRKRMMGETVEVNLREFVRKNASKEICVKRYVEIIAHCSSKK